MKFLQTLEGYDYILLGLKFLSLGHQGLLLGEILLEVIVAQLLIDFELVVKFLHGLLIALPYVAGVLLGHVAYFLKLGLELAHFGEHTVYIIGIRAHFHKFVDDFLFAVIVGLELCLKSCSLGRFFLLDDTQQFLERLFVRVGRRHKRFGVVTLDSFVGLALGAHIFIAQRVELLFRRATSSAGISAASRPESRVTSSSISGLVSERRTVWSVSAASVGSASAGVSPSDTVWAEGSDFSGVSATAALSS